MFSTPPRPPWPTRSPGTARSACARSRDSSGRWRPRSTTRQSETSLALPERDRFSVVATREPEKPAETHGGRRREIFLLFFHHVSTLSAVTAVTTRHVRCHASTVTTRLRA